MEDINTANVGYALTRRRREIEERDRKKARSKKLKLIGILGVGLVAASIYAAYKSREYLSQMLSQDASYDNHSQDKAVLSCRAGEVELTQNEISLLQRTGDVETVISERGYSR